MTLDSFVAPACVHARPVDPGEKRVIVRGIAILCTVVLGVVTATVKELPTDISSLSLPLLVLTMDQGGIGAGGVYFGMGFKKLMLSVRWDRYHRGVNDLKLSCQHAAKGMFRRVMLLSTFVYNLNYGPFGKGAFFQDKKAYANSNCGPTRVAPSSFDRSDASDTTAPMSRNLPTTAPSIPNLGPCTGCDRAHPSADGHPWLSMGGHPWIVMHGHPWMAIHVWPSISSSMNGHPRIVRLERKSRSPSTRPQFGLVTS